MKHDVIKLIVRPVAAQGMPRQRQSGGLRKPMAPTPRPEHKSGASDNDNKVMAVGPRKWYSRLTSRAQAATKRWRDMEVSCGHGIFVAQCRPRTGSAAGPGPQQMSDKVALHSRRLPARKALLFLVRSGAVASSQTQSPRYDDLN